MINEGRTLLLNKTGVNRPPLGVYGEEYISDKYVAVAESTDTRILRRCLFGENPCLLTQNYRTAQYMAILHSFEWSELYILSLDDRITYRPNTGLANLAFGVNFEPNNTINDASYLYGDPLKSDELGVHLVRGLITFNHVSGDTATVNIESYTPAILKNKQLIVHVNTDAVSWYTDPILIADNLYIVLRNRTNNSIPESYSGFFSTTAKPQKDLIEIFDNLPTENVYACCNRNLVDGDVFLNIYKQAKRKTDRLAGALCALISETRRLRNA